MSRRSRLLLIALFVIPLGIGWRLLPLHLAPFAYKWGGSLLWGVMVYFLTAAAFPRFGPLRSALLAGVVATLVELSRLHHTPALDACRLTLVGKLLLGRVFSLWDIAAYWAAIAACARADLHVRKRPFAAPPV